MTFIILKLYLILMFTLNIQNLFAFKNIIKSWKPLENRLPITTYRTRRCSFRFIHQDLIMPDSKLSDILGNVNQNFEECPVGILDGATNNEKFKQTIRSYEINDLTTDEILDRISKGYMKTPIIFQLDSPVLSNIEKNGELDLWIKNIETDKKEKAWNLYFQF